MTFREFLKLEGEGFSIYGNPKVVNPVTKDIKTKVKLCKPPKDGKTSIGRSVSTEKRTIKPARPAGLHGSSSMTIKSVV